MSLTASATPAVGSALVPLSCPAGGRVLPEGCVCANESVLDTWEGIPRLYFGPCPGTDGHRAVFRKTASLLKDQPWSAALKGVPGGYGIWKDLTSDKGPDLLYGLPWARPRTALDIGAGAGFHTAVLARLAREVVALEPDPDAALFLAKRAGQEGWDNVRVLIADPLAPPFGPGSFDVITVSGLLEDVGLWRPGDPEGLQRDFLATLRRLLRPGGCVYLSARTRYGLHWWQGERDHAGLRFTSLLPRRLADWCSRRWGNHSGEAPAGYRTYCHTPRGYEELLRGAGFAAVEAFGCLPQPLKHTGLYDLGDFAARGMVQSRLNPAVSLRGILGRAVRDCRGLYRQLEKNVLLVASTDPAPPVWPGFTAAERPSAQFNTYDKACPVSLSGGVPGVIGKSGKYPVARELLEREYQFLEDAERRAGTACADWPVRWPRPLGRHAWDGRTLYHYEFARGYPLSQLLYRPAWRLAKFFRLFTRLAEGYADMCARMSAGLEGGSSSLPNVLEAFPLEDAVLRRRVRDGCEKLRRGEWRIGWTHGDLTPGNAIVTASGQLMLIDWENASAADLPAIDLVRLVFDIWEDVKGFRPAKRDRIMAGVRATVRGVLARSGFGDEVLPEVEALYVAHQCDFIHNRGGEIEAILRNYRDRPLAAGGE